MIFFFPIDCRHFQTQLFATVAIDICSQLGAISAIFPVFSFNPLQRNSWHYHQTKKMYNRYYSRFKSNNTSRYRRFMMLSPFSNSRLIGILRVPSWAHKYLWRINRRAYYTCRENSVTSCSLVSPDTLKNDHETENGAVASKLVKLDCRVKS